MLVHLTRKNGVPLYLQIKREVTYLIAAGRLKPADSVPPIRVLAEELSVNPNTVARSYRELENAGILIRKQGSGTFVSAGSMPLAWHECIKLLTDHVDDLLAEAHRLDVSAEQVRRMVEERAQQLFAHSIVKTEHGRTD